MDFNFLDDVANGDKIESGAWLQFTNPVTQSLWFLDADAPEPKKPVRVLVRSVRSDAYKLFEQNEQRAAYTRSRRPKKDDSGVGAQEVMKARRRKEFALLVMGFENLPGQDEGVIKPEVEDLIKLADDKRAGWMVEQVFAAAGDDTRYGADVEGNVDAEATGLSTGKKRS